MVMGGSSLSPQAYDFFFRSTADGILVTDEKGTIEAVNPAAAAMLGVKPDDLIGTTPNKHFHNNAAIMNLFSRSGDQLIDVRLPKRRLAVGIATTLENGQRVVLLQDITEKRELDSRRESLIRAIAHDLHNPLSALSGFADLVVKLGPLNEQQTRFLTRIQQTTAKLYELVEPLVDLAWMEAGMPLTHVPTQLAPLIDRVVIQLGALALEKKMTIAVSVQDPLPVVMGDPERIRLVIYHLLHNAITYSDREQTVAIHAWGDDEELFCSVADRGMGIADDELELVFDRMYRSRDERVRDIAGGGLGLTVSKTIITRHGGDIWAASNLGEGSTFTFLLPVVRL
jgi:signal transduction histidine kinase